jgi:IS30 family transposase
MKPYTQLTQVQRYQIYALMKAGQKHIQIARLIGVHKSTISRELRRNRGGRGYRPKQAHCLALSRRDKAKRRINPMQWQQVEQLIRQDWSPEQVSGWLARRGALRISHEWIYQHILADKQCGGTLYKHLRCQRKRRKRYGSYDRRGRLSGRIGIEQRPAIVTRRQRLGDWEVDTVLGKGRRYALVTLTERRSRLARLIKVTGKTAPEVRAAIVQSLEPLKAQVHTLTSDNGKEFAEHAAIARKLQADFYFAHPQAAWERGSNENMNGLLRQYFPKERDFSTLSQEELEFAMLRLNHRPRKCLDFKTPIEVFLEQSVALTS